MSVQRVLSETHAKNENSVVFSSVEVALAIALALGNAVRGGLSAKCEKSFPAYWAAICVFSWTPGGLHEGHEIIGFYRGSEISDFDSREAQGSPEEAQKRPRRGPGKPRRKEAQTRSRRG